MSRPMNMLRTRRKDCNVKPNRRLDRKSSRGMIYENEELRLKTININAEVESRVSDIKKLKKENEMLKKGLWYLRDEYDKLERLIKDKKIDFSSSSTTTGSTSSDSESCSSYSEGGEEVETTQNLKNVQKTNLKNLQDQFDHLSVVTEETSAENSELHSNRVSLTKDTWSTTEDILKPDQCYPDFITSAKSPTLPMADDVRVNFFSPIRTSQTYEDAQPVADDEVIYPGEFYSDQQQFGSDDFVTQKMVKTNSNSFYQNMILVPKTTAPEIELEGMEKSATDLIVKIDNRDFNDKSALLSNTPSLSTFSNGGNLEELLNDIESISQDILKTSNLQKATPLLHPHYGYAEGFDFGQPILGDDTSDKQFKSELNVVLVPKPMPLIGFDKYKNVQRSFENLTTKPPEEIEQLIPAPNLPHIPAILPEVMSNPNPEVEPNPFFFGNFKDNYVNADHFAMRYNPDAYDCETDNVQASDGNKNYPERTIDVKKSTDAERLQKFGSKTNLLELTSSEHVSSENEAKPEKTDGKTTEKPRAEPKLSIRKKVSIHFKGKKEKNKLSNGSDTSASKTPNERRGSMFDVRFSDKPTHQKTSSNDTQKSTGDIHVEPKTPSSSDSKNSDKKSDKKESGSDKKSRKSASTSPDRKHVHVKDDAGQQQSKKHKKHKRSEKKGQRRLSSLDQRVIRERSFSVCTDRSNIMEHRLGHIFGSNLYFDDFSDRERTNSMSSCETAENRRKMSMLPNAALSGKVPWCGCWGNGCL
ncbi:unnamed protein product [Phyllotreta striolata]|uniref:Uncharacterized protein n=1 Tax=Phyllotreta striolata TaxID=444603 RepID=A0A9N9XIF4_PHYSR|nr:unnamed protein product [Phyllotreta striolata]